MRRPPSSPWRPVVAVAILAIVAFAGVWPSGDGTRMYVGLENDDALVAIDTTSNEVVGQVGIGQAPQALNYVSNAVPRGDGLSGLQSLGVAGQAAHLTMVAAAGGKQEGTRPAPTSVTLFDQGLVQVLEASATGLMPSQPYVLALADNAEGSGVLQPLASFMTNPAGSAIVNAIGPIRQIVQEAAGITRRYLVIAPQVSGRPGTPVQIQVP